ncbi:hypothetical protein NDU88_004115, partial [Pleurodeles waltl]
EEIQTAILDYCKINQGLVSSAGTLWEAFNVVIWGICLAKQHGVLRALRRKLAGLEAQLAGLDRRLASAWSASLSAEFREVLSCYKEAALRKGCYLGKEAKARRYGEGERAGKT